MIGDKVRIRKNYILHGIRPAFSQGVENRIESINRIATISACFQKCSYDLTEPGYMFKEISRLVFKESMIKDIIEQSIEYAEPIEEKPPKKRWEILDLRE